jgi:hypothetical protein
LRHLGRRVFFELDAEYRSPSYDLIAVFKLRRSRAFAVDRRAIGALQVAQAARIRIAHDMKVNAGHAFVIGNTKVCPLRTAHFHTLARSQQKRAARVLA